MGEVLQAFIITIPNYANHLSLVEVLFIQNTYIVGYIETLINQNIFFIEFQVGYLDSLIVIFSFINILYEFDSQFYLLTCQSYQALILTVVIVQFCRTFYFLVPLVYCFIIKVL